MASCKHSTQKLASMRLLMHHASTRREYQSMMANQVRESVIEPNICDVGAPHLIGSRDGHTPQQVRVDFVRRMRAGSTGVGAGGDTCEPHAAHEPLHALSIDGVPVTAQKQHHAPGAIERPRGVLLVDELAEYEIGRASLDRARVCVHGGARNACQRALRVSDNPCGLWLTCRGCCRCRCRRCRRHQFGGLRQI